MAGDNRTLLLQLMAQKQAEQRMTPERWLAMLEPLRQVAAERQKAVSEVLKTYSPVTPEGEPEYIPSKELAGMAGGNIPGGKMWARTSQTITPYQAESLKLRKDILAFKKLAEANNVPPQLSSILATARGLDSSAQALEKNLEKAQADNDQFEIAKITGEISSLRKQAKERFKQAEKMLPPLDPKTQDWINTTFPGQFTPLEQVISDIGKTLGLPPLERKEEPVVMQAGGKVMVSRITDKKNFWVTAQQLEELKKASEEYYIVPEDEWKDKQATNWGEEQKQPPTGNRQEAQNLKTGRKIYSTDGGNTWYDAETNKRVE